jgi:DNA-binding IclR family transcriptional regulator
VARSSPPSDRIVRLLDHLAAAPDRAFTLSELVRDVGISQATCLGIVNVLVRRGYVVRDNRRKTYKLGPTLIGIGRAAQQARPSLGRASQELQRLYDGLGYPCTAAATSGDYIVVLDHVGTVTADPRFKVGQRYPLVPPSGTIFVAWQSDSVIKWWLSRSPKPPSEAELGRLSNVVDACRNTGYVVERLSELQLQLQDVLAGHGIDELTTRVMASLGEAGVLFGRRDYITEELESAGPFPVASIVAPTFDADGAADLLLGVNVYAELSRARIRQLGKRLRSACDEVTAGVGGFDPWRRAMRDGAIGHPITTRSRLLTDTAAPI